MIVAHIGKRGAGAVTGVSFFGWLSGALEDVFKRGRESVSHGALKTRSAREILAMDKDNFDVKYTEVVRGELIQEEFHTIIRLLTGSDKFEFQTGKSFDQLVLIMKRFLGVKISVQRASRASQVD
jgi:hypothetical protein